MKAEAILFKEYLKNGYNQKDAATLSGLNPKNAHYYVKKYNMTVLCKFKRKKVNETYFDEINSERKAYLLGFFIADGYLTKDISKNGNTTTKRICINQSIDDLEIVKIFQSEISPESNITFSNKQAGAKFRKKQATLRITSNHMYDLLETKYGILKAKTFNKDFLFPLEHIEKPLRRHFIRGYFDGDGCVSFTARNNLFNMSFSMIFNSIYFCEQIAKIMEEELSVKRKIYTNVGRTTTWYTLQFRYDRDATNAMKRIYEYFYKDSSVFLSRKKIKFEDYFEYRAKSGHNKPEQRRA